MSRACIPVPYLLAASREEKRDVVRINLFVLTAFCCSRASNEGRRTQSLPPVVSNNIKKNMIIAPCFYFRRSLQRKCQFCCNSKRNDWHQQPPFPPLHEVLNPPLLYKSFYLGSFFWLLCNCSSRLARCHVPQRPTRSIDVIQCLYNWDCCTREVSLWVWFVFSGCFMILITRERPTAILVTSPIREILCLWYLRTSEAFSDSL